MKRLRRARDPAPLVPGPVVAWRSWALSGNAATLRLCPVAGNRRPWPPRRAAEATCRRRRFHQAPNLSCTCGLHGTREPELLRRTRSPVVVGTAALWGTIVEHEFGYRARFGYPERIRLVCPICFWQWGIAGSSEPITVAVLRGERRMPLCERHLDTAGAVELSMRDLTPAGDVLRALLDVYGVRELLRASDGLPGAWATREVRPAAQAGIGRRCARRQRQTEEGQA